MIIFLILGCTTDPIPPDGQPDISTTEVETVAKPIEAPEKETKVIQDLTGTVPEVTETETKPTTTVTPVKVPTKDPIIPTPNIDAAAKKDTKEKQITAEELGSHMNKTAEEVVEEVVEEKDTAEKNILTVKETIAQNAYFNEENGELYVRVFKDTNTLASGMAHDHVILAKRWEGQIQWNENEPHNCLLEFQIPVHFLDVDSDRMRRKVKLPGKISSGDRKTIKDHMLAKDQLWAKKHAYITLSANECIISDTGIKIDSTLQIRGKKRTIEPIISINTEAGFKVKGAFRIKLSNFGIKPYSGFFGAVKNKDIVSIHIDLHDK